jgi:hypothetical protein
LKACKGNIEHLESRKTAEEKKNFDIFMGLEISSNGLLHLMKSLRQANLADVTILREKHISVKGMLTFIAYVILINGLYESINLSINQTRGFLDT